MADVDEVRLLGEWPDGGTIGWGRNSREHGHEFFLLVQGSGDFASVRIPDCQRKQVAACLRRFLKRIDPPKRTNNGPGGDSR